MEVVEHDQVRMTIWDMGGQQKIRKCWQNYFLQATGLIFVIDSADQSRFDEAKMELHKILNSEDIKAHSTVPLLVYANKQDSPLAINAANMASMLELDQMNDQRPKFVQGAHACSGDGLRDGLTWLTGQLKLAMSRKK